METAATLRSITGVLWTTHHARSSFDKPLLAPLSIGSFRKESSSKVSFRGCNLTSSNKYRGLSFPCYVKASEAASNVATDGASSAKNVQGSLEKKVQKSAFPIGCEKLILGVCDETDIAELKVKVGDFEMHVKRYIPVPAASIPPPPPIVSPISAPPTKPSPAAAPAASQKASAAPKSPFTNVSPAKASKLAALEAFGAQGYVIVSSPTVGSFRKGRTFKGKKQPPSCKEGDVIKEGQVIGYLDQFGNELPIKSDAAGEVLKILYQDGEAVGYGDPLIALLPSFQGIK